MRDRNRLPGRHPHHALTARSVSSLSSTGRARRVADGGGLYLLIAPNGSKSWVLRTLVHKRRCDVGLGSVSLVSLAEAREEARRLRKIARAGGDPLGQRLKDRREVPTFTSAAKDVHVDQSASFRSDKHRKQWLSSLDGAITVFGSKRVDTVGSNDILAALSPIWLRQPETARRVLQRIRLIFEWCKAKGYCTGDNPTQGLSKVLPKQPARDKHHSALPYAKLPDFLRALRASDASELVKLAFEFTILCASRTQETLLASWDEVDFETSTWTIPGARMKAKKEHRVPMSPRATEILKQVQALSDQGPYIFPGRKHGKSMSNMVFLMALRRMDRDDLVGDATAHGFRSTFRDWAEEQTNFPQAVTEAALAHTVRDKVEAAYRRTDLFDRRRDLMASWSTFATSPQAAVP